MQKKMFWLPRLHSLSFEPLTLNSATKNYSAEKCRVFPNPSTFALSRLLYAGKTHNIYIFLGDSLLLWVFSVLAFLPDRSSSSSAIETRRSGSESSSLIWEIIIQWHGKKKAGGSLSLSVEWRWFLCQLFDISQSKVLLSVISTLRCNKLTWFYVHITQLNKSWELGRNTWKCWTQKKKVCLSIKRRLAAWRTSNSHCRLRVRGKCVFFQLETFLIRCLIWYSCHVSVCNPNKLAQLSQHLFKFKVVQSTASCRVFDIGLKSTIHVARGFQKKSNWGTFRVISRY